MAILRYAGAAPEVADINDPAPEALFHADIASATLDVPSSPTLQFAGGMGRGRNLHRPGFYAPAGNIVYAMDIRTAGWFIYWAFGGYMFTAGDVGPPQELNTHEVWASTENFLPNFCARLGKDHFEHVFRGCVINSLEISVESEFAQVTIDVQSRKDERAMIQDIEDLLLPEEFPLVFHEVTATRDGSDVSPRVNSLTFTFNNSANTDSARHIGNRHPGEIPVFEREVNVNATLKYLDIDEIQRFWGDADGPDPRGQDETEFGFGIHFDAGDDGELDLQMPRCIYDTVPTQPSGRGEVTQNVVMHAYQTEHMLADTETVVRSEVLATLQNNQDDLTNGS